MELLNIKYWSFILEWYRTLIANEKVGIPADCADAVKKQEQIHSGMKLSTLRVWQPADVRKNKTAQSRRVTGFAARRQTMEPLEFSKTGKKRRVKRQIFCFCGVTVVSSTVFEREISCQHVDVNMRMLRFFFFLWRNLALFPGGVNQFLIGTFTPVSSLCMMVCYYGTMDSPSD